MHLFHEEWNLEALLPKDLILLSYEPGPMVFCQIFDKLKGVLLSLTIHWYYFFIFSDDDSDFSLRTRKSKVCFYLANPSYDPGPGELDEIVFENLWALDMKISLLCFYYSKGKEDNWEIGRDFLKMLTSGRADIYFYFY